MWGEKVNDETSGEYHSVSSGGLKEAIQQARIDSADRADAVVESHEAEIVQLEILDEALDPVFDEIPPEIDLFDRGISRGDRPRLWIDSVAHVDMARGQRQYRFVQDGP